MRSGDLLANRYRLVQQLGRGSFGEVWTAEGPDGQRVVVKALLPAAAARADVVSRFEREARAATLIASQRVCRLLEAQTAAPGPYYLVWEHWTGETLEELLARDDLMSFDDLLPILEDLLDALIATHAAGVVHRDLKPQNVLVEPEADGRMRARLIDFGVAKLDEPEGELLTTDGQTLGSVAFCAPEQIEHAALVDARADLYALGTLAFYALAGRLPFAASTPAALLALKVNQRAPTLSSVTGEQWPAGIERWVGALLGRHPGERPASAKAALAELAPLRTSGTRRTAKSGRKRAPAAVTRTETRVARPKRR